MRNKLILTAAAAALAVPAMAQVGVDVDATTEAGVGVEAPVAGTLDTVQDTVDTVSDTAQDAVNTATDTAVDTTDQASDAATSAEVQPAAAADVKAGAEVRDTDGNMVGTVESVDANGAVIATGEARVQIPVTSFAKNDQGLVITMSKAELEAAAEAATPS